MNGTAVAAVASAAVVIGIVAALVLSNGNSSTNNTTATAATTSSPAAASPTAPLTGEALAIASMSAAEAANEAAAQSDPVVPSANVTLPSSAGGLTEMTAAQMGPQLKQALAKAAANPQLDGSGLAAAYAKTGTSTFISDLILVPMPSSSVLEDMYTSQGAAGMLTGITSSSQGFSEVQQASAAIPNSAVACGIKDDSGSNQLICIWADAESYGTLALDWSVGVGQAIVYAEALEDATDGFTS